MELAPRPDPDGSTALRSLRPVIEELVQTRLCPSQITLLVDRMSITILSSDTEERQAFRLWLSDGIKSLQAVAKQEFYPFLVSQTIREGSYIWISGYTLEFLDRLNGEGQVCVIFITDMQAISHDGRPRKPFRFEYIDMPAEGFRPDTGSNSEADIYPPSRGKSKDTTPEQDEVSLVAIYSTEKRGKLVKREQTDIYASPSEKELLTTADPDEEDIERTPSRLTKERQVEILPQKKEAPDIQSEVNEAKTILRPLKVTPLSRLTGPRVIRNKVHDVLAVVCSVDDVVIRRKDMPEQRNLRITDCSTTKMVQLTVFVDAPTFRPAPGTVALFRNVTTHEWDGGSLKAYHRDCGGFEWFFLEPEFVDGADLELLRQHWRENVQTN